ncbi:MAG: hypothetical protein RLZ37_1814, partial [Actinomycetota bacterium]
AIGGALSGTSLVRAGQQAVFGVDYYISAPLVQGSYVDGSTSGSLETFDAPMPTGACPSSFAGGITVAPGSECRIDTVAGHGGATGSSPDPVVGEPGSQFATTTGGDASTSITLLMPSPQKYLGFWWSAGNSGNLVTFYSGETKVLEVNTDGIFNFLGAAPQVLNPSPLDTTFEDTGQIQSVGGTSYFKHHYFGMPRGYTSIPIDQTQWNGTYTKAFPFVYMHVFSQGGLTFDRVVYSGQGFEFDNLVVSPLSQTVNPSLVKVGSVTGTPPPDFEPEGPSTPSFDGPTLDHYVERSALPDTGGATNSLPWLALGLVTGGASILITARRLRFDRGR